MRILRFTHDGGARYGRLDDDLVTPLSAAPWETGGKPEPAGVPLPLASVSLLPPVAPSKILCIGRNYASHAAELGHEVPKEPLVFYKPPSSLLAPGGTVVLPPEAGRVDYEGELVLVIGKRARRVGREAWRDVVFGITCGLDVTARELQKKDGQWWRAKGFDTFCPLGPWIETDADPSDLLVETRVAGEVRQSARTTSFLFDVGTVIEWLSAAVTLEPGDAVFTGTPEGVGPLSAGQRVEVTIESVGTLGVSVAAETVG